jgi:hypothetical protein
MQSRPESIRTSQLLLAKGQSHFEQLPRGTVIRVAAGSVALVQRTALDHCMLAQQTTMHRGAVHCLEVAAWVEIVAQSDSALVVMVPKGVSLVQEMRAGLEVVLARLVETRRNRLPWQWCRKCLVPWL